MRTSILLIAALVGGFVSSSANAATTTHLVERGTAVDLSLGAALPTTQPDCTLDVSLSLTAVTSIEHVGSGGGSGSGAHGFMQVADNCAGRVEFGSFDVTLGSGAFTTGPRTGTLSLTVVVTLSVYDPDFNFIGTIDRTLVASSLVFDGASNETLVSKSHLHSRYPGFSSVSDGHTVERPATLSGSLKLDGQSLFPSPTTAFSASFETSHEVFVNITK